MSVPNDVLSMYEDIWEECLAEAIKNMAPLGYSPAEIRATAQEWFEQRCEAIEYR